ncbi:MAG: ATP-binding cassette domain-containing protein [Synechococcaceae cyanobacterium SM2_3_1]|nr:ATP-binding cassette domain-containing protein [Synechococcaceae cyanobacterium SM2_3_1]
MASSLNSSRQQVNYSPQIAVRGLTKLFLGHALYSEFDLTILKNKITCIFGPNGCGKSTLLNMIAGLIKPDSGEILFEGKGIDKVKIGYVFQNYREALFPWLRAFENIEYPLKITGLAKQDRYQKVQTLVESFDIKINLSKYPYQLSGGQQQLVSIMRALVTQPEVLFLDEPFSALDYETTLFIRDKLQDIFQASQISMVMVSHDLEEAVYMADRVLLLTKAPTRVADEVDFFCPRPRTFETLSTSEFISVKSHCLEVFQREVRR